ncbi:MAG TPA: hypothetical protein VNL12_03005 [Iamia sp.]|nr:hypothetical protein [Iamia sp.]HXH56249.1 hypothetical protein [Iamia sp.]
MAATDTARSASAGRDPEFGVGDEGGAGERRPQQVDGGIEAVAAHLEVGHLLAELGLAALEHVADRGGEQVGLGRVVVQHRPERHAGPVSDLGGRGAPEAPLDADTRRLPRPRHDTLALRRTAHPRGRTPLELVMTEPHPTPPAPETAP